MTISLTNLIADVEAKIAAANSSTSTDELLKIIKAARAANTIANTYDSSGAMPVDAANVGNVLMSASDNFLYVLDSAGGSWSSITGSGGGGGSTFSYQGSASAYILGGWIPSPNAPTTAYEKFSLTSDGNATDTADLTVARQAISGAHSETNSYSAGGMNWNGYVSTNIIEKFPFATDGDATDTGDLTSPRDFQTSASSGTHGYISGGQNAPTNLDIIDKFNMATDGNATDVGDLTGVMWKPSGASDVSAAYGYVYGGEAPSGVAASNKFSFASDGNATTLTGVPMTHPSGYNRRGGVGANSTTYAYQLGAETNQQTLSNDVVKFSFAAENAITEVGELTKAAAELGYGNSSTTYAYHSGGRTPGFTNVIEKIDFSSDGNGTDVGDLSVSRKRGAEGTQV
jgi:hypothetical protein